MLHIGGGRRTVAGLGIVLLFGTLGGRIAPASGVARVDHVRSPAVPADTIRLTDDLGRSHIFYGPPARIVTLVPVAAEILFSVGEGARVVGRSRYADYPPEVLDVPSVGDAIRPAIELVIARRPDLVILVAGSDNRSAVGELDRLGVPVFPIVINTFEDLDRNIRRLGLLTGAEAEARMLAESITAGLKAVEQATSELHRPAVYYDVGYPPAFTVGAGSYLDRLISIGGGTNVFGDLNVPSAQVSLEAIVDRDPELIVFPIPKTGRAGAASPDERPGWSVLRAARPDRIRTVDVDLLSRLGPRVARAARELAEAIHPELAGNWPETTEGRP